MKKTGKWVLSVITKVIVIILVILVMLLFGKDIWHFVVSDITGDIRVQSEIIEQKLESSQRLEVTTIDEEGVLVAKTSVKIFGEVGSTTIRYRYTASIGIDLSKVLLTADTDRIIFTIPDTEILNDGIEALEVKKNDFISKRIDKEPEVLLAEQRLKCREQYRTETLYSKKAREDAVKAFNDTVCRWLDSSGERQYEFEIRFANDTAAE